MDTTMRALVLALALLTGLKLWYRDQTYRAAADQAVVAAYLPLASAACQKVKQTDDRGQPLGPILVNWTTPEQSHLSAGNTQIPVSIWQVDNGLWNARFKNPHLILEAGSRLGGLTCAYDIAGGQASLGRT
jgi:hypothetical protein